MDHYTLWGTPHSLYTGKARSYLIKKGVPFVEHTASDPRFLQDVVGRIGHMVVPIVETPEGEVVQDTTAIIDLLESRFPTPDFSPAGAVQRVVADVLDAFGSNYLLPLAMHYRWSFRDEQELFLRTEFARAVPQMPHAERLATAGNLMDRFAGFLPRLGVEPAVIPAMEASYEELLAALELHFQEHPYLLGGRPSIADFGMMAPLFAHLGRDPVPASLMKTKAPSVFRWTERMNSPAIVDSDNCSYPDGFPEGDAIPETLVTVLAVAFAGWAPGLAADAAQFEAWLAELSDPAAGTLVSRDGRRTVHPDVGRVSYPWRGVTVHRASQPHSLWHFARAQEKAAGLAQADAERLAALLERVGGTETMALRTSRAIARRDNVLVLA